MAAASAVGKWVGCSPPAPGSATPARTTVTVPRSNEVSTLAPALNAEHRAWVKLVPRMRTRRSIQRIKKFRARCSCGWVGPARLRYAVAFVDSEEHVSPG